MIANGTLETAYTANTSESLHNYFAMTAGVITKTLAKPSENIFDQLQTAGTSWVEYEQSMPSACNKESTERRSQGST